MKKWLVFIFGLCCMSQVLAANRTYNLNLNYKQVNYTGVISTAMAINNQVPGPALYFKVGDWVNINVHNHLRVGTALHWHGLLVRI